MGKRFTNLGPVAAALAAGLLSVAPPRAGASGAADAKAAEFFEQRVRPVLVNSCYRCHSAEAKEVKGGLRLDTRDGIRKGGTSGPAVVPANLKDSRLLEAIRYHDPDTQMPPDGKLPDAVIADFERWIEAGAADPRGGQGIVAPAAKVVDPAEARRTHWAFQPPRKPPVPAVKTADWPRGEIDQFVLARLEDKGLTPAPDADRRTLLRRVYFDLVGLPPTPAEVDAFLNDSSPDAFAKVVDRLLASPHYGERWGRHWLDVARYAESNGRDRNALFPHAWRYRDYVIASFNADKPYDRFVTEQIAGDLLPADSPEQRDERHIATGFLALGGKNFAEVKPEQFRMDMVDEQIDATTRSVLALTVSCARCHDHKYDPVSQREFYALAGIFRSTRTLYGYGPRQIETDNNSALQPIGKDAAALDAVYTAHVRKLIDMTAARNHERVLRYRIVRKVADLTKDAPAAPPDGAAAPPKDPVVADLEAQIAAFDAKLKVMDAELAAVEAAPPPAPDYAMAACEEPAPVHLPVYFRGEVSQPGEAAPRAVLPLIAPGGSPPPIPAGQSGRLQLAQTLTSPDNPLTARVAVNRVWMHLLGQGLVRSVDNFGTNGERPTHPELLDWLAVRFIECGWSVKRTVREIVLSRTYQLSARHDPARFESHLAADPENRLLWHRTVRRIDVEALRDAMLAAAGQLDLAPPGGGSVVATVKGFDEFINGHRLTDEQLDGNCRSVYLPVARAMLPEMFALFDFADPSITVGQRDERTMPTQALYLMNSRRVIGMSEQAAARLLAAEGLDEAGRVTLAYKTFLSRPPVDAERDAALQYLKDAVADGTNAQAKTGADAAAPSQPLPDPRLSAWAGLCQGLLASAEFRYLE